jgi:hypothetical protein
MTKQSDGSVELRDSTSECWKCVYKREIPGNCHIGCANPDTKMTGDVRGVRNGWFFYPFMFDPIWKEKLCSNFEEKTS